MGYQITPQKGDKIRKKIVAQRKIFDQAVDTLMAILKPAKKLMKMDAIIDANPDIVETIHVDLTKGVKSVWNRGMSAERVLAVLF